MVSLVAPEEKVTAALFVCRKLLSSTDHQFIFSAQDRLAKQLIALPGSDGSALPPPPRRKTECSPWSWSTPVTGQLNVQVQVTKTADVRNEGKEGKGTEDGRSTFKTKEELAMEAKWKSDNRMMKLSARA